MNIIVDPLLFLQSLREATGGIFNDFFLNATIFGDFLPTIVILCIIYWCLDKKLGEYLVISYGATNLLTSFAKIAATIYRPWILDSRIQPVKEAMEGAKGYSFPSGHTSNATTVFGGSILKGNFSKIFNTVFIICLAIIAFSRLYLGVHSILDVSFAIISSLVILVIFRKLFDKLEEMPNLDVVISAVGVILAILALAYCMTKSFPMDYDAAGKLIVDPVRTNMGFFSNTGLITAIFLSWPLERRFIRFSSDGKTETKIIRLVVGIIGLGIVKFVIAPLLGSGQLELFLKDFLLGLYVVLIYPAVIRFAQKSGRL